MNKQNQNKQSENNSRNLQTEKKFICKNMIKNVQKYGAAVIYPGKEVDLYPYINGNYRLEKCVNRAIELGMLEKV